MHPARDAVLTRVQAAVAGELPFRRFVRRRVLRGAFYALNLAALLLLATAYAGTHAAIRLPLLHARTLATRTELGALSRALARYGRDHAGELPRDAAGVIEALATPRPDGAPYYAFDSARLGPGGYLDDFGHPYRVLAGAGRCVVYSVGPDGQDDGAEGDDLARPVE